MRGLYTVSFSAITFTRANGDYDFFELNPVAEKPIEIVAIYVASDITEGDFSEEQVSWGIVRGHTTTGSGTAVTPIPVDPAEGAASFTAKRSSITVAADGSPVTLHNDTFNARIGLQLIFLPEMRPKSSERLVVRLLTALDIDLILYASLYVREL